MLPCGSRWRAQVVSYGCLYAVQGLLLGAIGPLLQELSTLAQCGVAAFGVLFSAQGFGAVLASVFADTLLSLAEEKDGAYLVLLPSALVFAIILLIIPYVAHYGIVALSILFFFKGIVVAFCNFSINRCCVWIYADESRRGRKLQHILFGGFGLGTLLGPLLVLLVIHNTLPIEWVFSILAACQAIVILALTYSDTPRPEIKRSNESVALLGRAALEQALTTYPSVLPSPISGGLFLHIKRSYSSHLTLEPQDEEMYDPVASFIVLLATFLATCSCGVQLALGAFLFECIRHRLNETFLYSAISMTAFWCAVLTGYFILRLIFKWTKCPKWVLLFQVVSCAASSGWILEKPDNPLVFLVGLMIYGFMSAAIFTNSLEILHRSLGQALRRRMSSMIIFGAACGEMFLPMICGFFMGNYSGAMFGTVAILYITCILSITMVGITILLLMTVAKMN